MKSVIGCKSIKTFVRALKFLARYSQEYVFEATDTQLHIRTCSNNQISLATVSFDELFFVRYEHSGSREDSVCRVSAKVLLTILKNQKSIASLTIKIDVPRDCLHINIHKNNDFVVQNRIALLEFDELDTYNLPIDHSEVLCHPSVFRRVLLSSTGIDELFFQFTKEGVKIQSYIDYPDDDCENVRLIYEIDVSEFVSYNLVATNTIIASCDDFVNLLNLAQSLEVEISMKFTRPGKPIITSLRSDGHYSMSLVQSTIPPKAYRRHISNLSYPQVVKSFIGKRNDDTPNVEATVNDSGIFRAANPKISFTTSKDKNKSNNDVEKSDNTYISTPSEIRGKRKSTEEGMLEYDGDVTKDNVMEKRRRTELNSTVIGCNTTVAGTTNRSIVLSKKELNEVNDIMSEIFHLPLDDDVELPATPRNEQLNFETESHDVDSHDRWPLLNNSYLKDIENVGKENESAAGNNDLRVRTRALDSLFGHIFKPRSRNQFGRVLVEGSESESEDIV